MCVAGLNVALQPCSHRWYQLVRSCDPSTNLANCPQKLKLEGWETRNDTCPWCNNEAPQIDESTHRLFGSASNSVPTSPDLGATRQQRSGSACTISTLSRSSSAASAESDRERGQRHRDMNDRLHLYLTTDPHTVLPSAKKNYPTSKFPATVEVRDISPVSDGASVRSNGSKLGNGWKKSVRLSKGIFKG